MAFIQLMPLSKLSGWDQNYRTGDIPAIKKSLQSFGMLGALRVKDSVVMAGNQTLAALRSLKEEEAEPPLNVVVRGQQWFVPTIDISHLSDAEVKAFAIADNRTHDLGRDDEVQLATLLQSLGSESGDLLSATGYDGDDLVAMLKELGDVTVDESQKQVRGSLSDRFLMPPFTVFDARSAAWQERKEFWIGEGIRSEVGRADNLLYARSAQSPGVYEAKNELESAIGRELTWPEYFEMSPEQEQSKGTSIFDPVLCELIYRWFSPASGKVLDPFAGGCVRGVVASRLGLEYVGVDLRPEQVAANEAQAPDTSARWIVGDSSDISNLAPGEYDLVFSCPPYGDLEVYSDLPEDLSAMDYETFVASLRSIIRDSVAMLKQDRFAVFVVGEFRDKHGMFRGFVPDVIHAFKDAGAKYYNEGVLLTNVGSLAIRAGRTFSGTRKLGKTHQNVLVFVKGDPKRATVACGEVVTEIPPDLELISGGTQIDEESFAA